MTRYQRLRKIMAFRELNPTEKVVLMMMAERADSRFTVYLSHAQIAMLTSLCERSVRTSLRDLDNRGFIERQSHRTKKGYRAVDRCYLSCLKLSFKEGSRHDYVASLPAKSASGLEAKFAAPFTNTKGVESFRAEYENVVMFVPRKGVRS